MESQLPKGAGVLCAVSGGRDSMVLLHLLKACGYAVSAAHLHHGLRGEEADRDQQFVKAYCKQENIPFYTARVNIGELARERGQSIEEAGREERRMFLQTTSLSLGGIMIATGHQLEDQAETILLNLTRGTGADGLRGIARRKGHYLRPLLTVSREEIAAYAEANHIPFVEDGTNCDVTYSRNRMRHLVLPQLEEINPSVCDTISRTAQIIAEESHLLDRLVVGMFPAEETRDGLTVDYQAFHEAEPALRRRVARMLIGRISVGRKDFSAVHFEAIANMKRGDCLILPKNAFAAVEANRLLVGVMALPSLPATLEEGEAALWNDWEFTATLENITEGDEDTVVLDPHGLRFPLTIGPFKSSDRISVKNGERTMKRLFLDAGIPVYYRTRVPVVYHQQKAVAAFGVATSDTHRPQKGQKNLVIRRKRKEKEKLL